MDSAEHGTNWLKAPFPTFSERNLADMAWSFGPVGKPPYGRHLRLLADGRIGGYIHPNEKYWRRDSESLTILSESGVSVTVFKQCEIASDGRLRLIGDFVANLASGLQHYLEETPEPYSISRDPDKFKIDKHFAGPNRRNLVIMGANEQSLHHQWERNINDADRNWDLCISFYGDPQNYPPPGHAEYTSLQFGVRKWIAIHRAMYEGSPLWDYERIFVLDDDILTTWQDINRFLQICRDLDLLLAQPSLKPDSCINHRVTAQQPDTLIRFTTFVEAMAPCFTRDALQQCIATAQGGYYGFGIDHLWPTILGLPKNRIGIVDAVAIDHTRPFATNYPIELAMAEGRNVQRLYGVGVLGYNVTGRLSLTSEKAAEEEIKGVSSDSDFITLINVGAAKGLQEKWEKIATRMTPVLFEPNPTEAAALRSRMSAYNNATIIEVGLSDRLGTQKLNITDHYGCISILKPNHKFLSNYSIQPLFNVQRVIDIECTRYDVLFDQGAVPKPDVIKIDVQGYEYQVLNGFGSLLHDCLAIELEAYLYALYEDQRLLGDLVSYLAQFGFVLRSLTQVHHFDGDCVEIDAIFTKNRGFFNGSSNALREKMRTISDALRVSQY